MMIKSYHKNKANFLFFDVKKTTFLGFIESLENIVIFINRALEREENLWMLLLIS